MRIIRLTASFLLLVSTLLAQSNQTISATTVPRLVRINNTFHAADGQAPAPVESMTLSIYRDEQGGSPLWQETQNVSVDSEGHYNVLMGSTLNEGLPVELFNASEPRWLGVKFNRTGEVEQPRTRLASVPYALRASDAETLGGKPASAYLLAETPGVAAGSVATSGTVVTVPGAEATPKPKTISGNQGFVPYFIDASGDLGNSVMQQASGSIGVGTSPGAGAFSTPSLDLRTYPFSQLGMGQTTDYLTFFASDAYGPAIYWDPAKDLRFGKGGSGLYNPFGFTEQMRIQSSTGNVGIGTQTPAAKLDVNGSINFSGSILFGGSPVVQVITAPGGGFGNSVALGVGALQNNNGPYNTATGLQALANNTTGVGNTANGYGAMALSTTGSYNTAVGYMALQGGSPIGASIGSANTAIGDQALQNNTTGSANTAIGGSALLGNLTGNSNIAVGPNALLGNTAGYGNIAVGFGALLSNTTGTYNAAIGQGALGNNTTGSGNIGIGPLAASNVPSGSSNNIHISNLGAPSDNGTIRIGDSNFQTSFFAAGVNSVNLASDPNAVSVLIDTTTGQLGVATSSRRYKEGIQDMGEASHNLMRLRPVTFRYKEPSADGSKPTQYGLIAEEVAEFYPDLVARSADGQIETVKYQVLDSMLLNELQRQQGEIRGLEQQNRSLQERLEKLEAALVSMAGK